MTRRHPSSPTPCPPLLPSCHAIVWLASLPNPGRNRGRMDFDLRTVFLLLAVIGTFTGKAYGPCPIHSALLAEWVGYQKSESAKSRSRSIKPFRVLYCRSGRNSISGSRQMCKPIPSLTGCDSGQSGDRSPDPAFMPFAEDCASLLHNEISTWREQSKTPIPCARTRRKSFAVRILRRSSTIGGSYGDRRTLTP
jgi:hypothetical protein